MNVDVRAETGIARAPAEVATFAGDPSHAPTWYRNIVSVEWKTPPPLAIGSRIAFVARFLGRTMAYTYKVVALVPGERLVMRTAEGPFPMETTHTWEPDGSGTHMTLRNRGTPTGFSRLVTPIMTSAMRRANNNDLRLLKRLLKMTPFLRTANRLRRPGVRCCAVGGPGRRSAP